VLSWIPPNYFNFKASRDNFLYYYFCLYLHIYRYPSLSFILILYRLGRPAIATVNLETNGRRPTARLRRPVGICRRRLPEGDVWRPAADGCALQPAPRNRCLASRKSHAQTIKKNHATTTPPVQEKSGDTLLNSKF